MSNPQPPFDTGANIVVLQYAGAAAPPGGPTINSEKWGGVRTYVMILEVIHPSEESETKPMHPVLRQTGMATEWNLTEIAAEGRADLKRKLLDPFYETLRQDMIKSKDSLDYPLVMDSNGVIHWKPDPLICALEKEGIIELDHLNLVANDDPNVEKALHKRLGSSLGGYADLLRGIEQAQ